MRNRPANMMDQGARRDDEEDLSTKPKMADPNLRRLSHEDMKTETEPEVQDEMTTSRALWHARRWSEIEQQMKEFDGRADGLASELHHVIEVMRNSGGLGSYENEVEEIKRTNQLNAEADALFHELHDGIASGSGKPKDWDEKMAKLSDEFADIVSRSHAASSSSSRSNPPSPTSGSGQKETGQSNDQLDVLQEKVKNAQKIADGALVRRAMESVVSSAEKGNYICVLDANCGPAAVDGVRRVIEEALKDHGIRIDECEHLGVSGTIPYARIRLSW